MRLLKTNTAIRILVGPFLDNASGEPEIALTVTNTICEMIITPNNGGAVTRTAITLTAGGGNNDMVHIADDIGGYYDLELTQSQTNFLGRMRLAFTDADVHMSFWEDFLVVPANVFDSFVLGTGTLEADMIKVRGSALTETVGGYLSAGIVKQYDVAKPVFTSESINQTADVKTVTDIISASKIAASMDAMSDIDFGAKMKVSLNASTPASIQGAVKSVTDNVNAQVKGIDNDVITASSLKADAVNEITAAIWAKIVDGTITFEKMSKVIVAFIAGNYTWDGSIMTVKDQAGATLFTMTITDAGGTGSVI